jgi:hypothetical protein
MTANLNSEIFPEQQKILFDILSEKAWISNFYLAGGTALALQIAHRQSIDFDFFTKDDFNNRHLIETLQYLGEFELFNEARNTINGILNDVRISFFKYPYPLLNSLFRHKNISIGGKMDIALMKIEAVSGRGSKKDFIDLYFLFREFSLSELFDKYPLKYGIKISNYYHLLKSMAYFEDAEREPMPTMLENVSWDQVKIRIAKEVKSVIHILAEQI